MFFSYIQSPCKDCHPPVRHSKCHATCEVYLKFKAELDAEKKRIFEENRTITSINDLNMASRNKKKKRKGSLKHGYKPKRR